MKVNIKTFIPYLISILFLFLFSCAIFAPQIKLSLFEDGSIINLDLKNAKLNAGDEVNGIAKTKHLSDYKEKTGEWSYWNSAQFSGGPISLLHLGSENNLIGNILKIITLNRTIAIGMFFALGLVAYISLCLLGLNNWISLATSLLYMLSLTFITLLEAGHAQKVYTLTYLPLILSGFILLVQNKNIKGGIALLLGISLAIYAGHIQMVYYLMIALIGFGIVVLIFAIKNKTLKQLLPSVSVALIVAAIAALSNFAQLYSSYNFSKQTMRGGGVLPKTETTVESTKKGLDWDYAMNWSYEVKDFFNIIVPRMVGGGSQEYVKKDLPAAKIMLQQPNSPGVNKMGKVAIPGYWSSMPFTSGGAYVGATALFLFLFSLLIIRKDLAIGFGVAFFIIFLLSLGENATFINKLLYNYAPLFDKFRAPSSASSILPAIILIAVGLGLKKLIDTKNSTIYLKKAIISASILSGILLIIYLFGGSMFSFLSERELSYQFQIQEAFAETRKIMQKQDALRSLFFVLATFGVVFSFIKGYLKNVPVLAILLAVLFTLDMLQVDRRYINKESYVKTDLYNQQFNMRPVDQQIKQLEPNGRGYYRLFDLSVNVFNDAKPSYYHNLIGGYDPTKLQRYQDIIDYHISKNNMQVLNMLNAKYFITNDGKLQTNTQANGNAWFVDSLVYVNSALDEINGLNNINTKKVAIINSTDFGNDIKVGNSEGEIKLTKYAPNSLEYSSNSNSNQLAVFSEVWYGGEHQWKAKIDGKDAKIIRVNYILRAIEIPEGNHSITMEFKPKPKGAIISTASSIIGLLLIIIAILNTLNIIKLPNIVTANQNEE